MKTFWIFILFTLFLQVNLFAQNPKKIYKYIYYNKIESAINQYEICKKNNDYNVWYPSK